MGLSHFSTTSTATTKQLTYEINVPPKKYVPVNPTTMALKYVYIYIYIYMWGYNSCNSDFIWLKNCINMSLFPTKTPILNRMNSSHPRRIHSHQIQRAPLFRDRETGAQSESQKTCLDRSHFRVPSGPCLLRPCSAKTMGISTTYFFPKKRSIAFYSHQL